MDDFEEDPWPRFLHYSQFDRRWTALGLNDAALTLLQGMLAANPAAGSVTQGTGGLRKVRFAAPGEGRGKSGSYRVGYFHFPLYGTVALVMVWGKNEKSNTSAAERGEIAKASRALQRALEKGTV